MVGNFDRFSVMNRVSGFPRSTGGIGSFNSFGNNGFGGVGGFNNFGNNGFGGIGGFNNFGNNGFGGIGGFNNFGNNGFGGGGFNSFANPYSPFGGGFGGGFGGIGGFGGGLGGIGALAASIGFLVGAIVQNIITRRQGNEGGEAQDSGCADKNSRMQEQHSNYMDGSAEHRWGPEGSTNMSFDVDT
jgi:hypothetical protein